ncbi:MAG: CRISPR-associated helicase Cas3' [Christensenellales bacterium]|jgi:CRISPR-associated helicase cas3
MLYAKSDPPESINEHTEKLLRNLKILRNVYENIVDKNPNVDERLWNLLEIACVYHDIGKVYSPFQNIILEKLGKEKLYTTFDYESIKHEQLSPMFIPTDDLNYTERKIIYQAIYYHHCRVHKKVNSNLVEKIIKEDILPRYDNIRSEIKYKLKDDLDCNYLGYVLGRNKIDEESEVYIKYCLLKGLLHRLDHSSSADVLVENKTEQSLGECTENSLKFKGYNGKNELQKFCKDNISNNILVIGSTGIGKTEAATIWSDIGKTFFTLPIRTSINAIYDRIKFDIGYKDVGLLHSSAVDYLEEKEDKFDYHLYEQTKNLGNRVIVCTIDQIFPFIFRYNGYEKIYATLAFSKVIIDEIQAYSPEITAIILKGIKMINDIGGKFMIMTATLPRIYKDELEKMGIKFKFGEFLKPIMRHKLSINDNSLDNDIENIINKASSSKVLVILNTIDKANELYLKIKEKNIENVNVLHSRFIKNDRSNKENSIINFSKEREKTGIWITTQIVEASLDIDFDYLFTEMSTLDSLFQRCGRCYRSRKYEKNEPNIYVYNKNVSGIRIYI